MNSVRHMESTIRLSVGIWGTECHVQEDASRVALDEPGMDTSINHVTDFMQITAHDGMSALALAADSKVMHSDKRH